MPSMASRICNYIDCPKKPGFRVYVRSVRPHSWLPMQADVCRAHAADMIDHFIEDVRVVPGWRIEVQDYPSMVPLDGPG